MERKLLLDKLDAVAPALSANVLVPVFTNFWFTGKHVMAYNDHIGISAKLGTEFAGAVSSTLASLLKASRAKDVSLELVEGVLQIKAASSKFKLPVLEPDTFAKSFTMPKMAEQTLPVDAAKFIAGIEDCLYSVSSDSAVPDYLGVTLLVKGKRMRMFSTTTKNLTCVTVRLKEEVPFERIILRGDFCKQVVRFGKGKKDVSFVVDDDYSMMQVDDVRVFGWVLKADDPQPYGQIYNRFIPEGLEKSLVSVPTKLELMLERAIIVCSGTNAAEEVRTNVRVRSSKEGANPIMHFQSRSGRGEEVKDTVMLEKKHPNIGVSLSAKLLKLAYGRFTHMTITEDAAIFADDDLSRIYMVSAYKEQEME